MKKNKKKTKERKQFVWHLHIGPSLTKPHKNLVRPSGQHFACLEENYDSDRMLLNLHERGEIHSIKLVVELKEKKKKQRVKDLKTGTRFAAKDNSKWVVIEKTALGFIECKNTISSRLARFLPQTKVKVIEPEKGEDND